VEIASIFRSGRTGATRNAVAGTFDGCVPDEFRGLSEPASAPALAKAIPAAMRARPIWRRRVTEFGEQPAKPRMSLVIAAGEAPEHLHTVLAMLLAEPGGRRVEIVVHHADGPATEMVRATAEALAAVHRIGVRVVSVASESFPSERLRAALVETRAPAVLALGAGCLPAAAGWLAAWKRRIGSGADPRVILAEVLGFDGSAREHGDSAGLNTAAVARLMQTRPLLPSIASDLTATQAVTAASARGLSVTAYERDADALSRMAEQLAVAAAKDALDA
jgi:hypothetical protein